VRNGLLPPVLALLGLGCPMGQDQSHCPRISGPTSTMAYKSRHNTNHSKLNEFRC